MDHIIGANGHTAAPPVYRFDVPGAGTAGTEELRDRPVFLLPHTKVDVALTTLPTGRYTLAGLYGNFLAPDLASGDAGTVAAAQPLRDWYRLACMNNANTHEPILGLEPIHSPVRSSVRDSTSGSRVSRTANWPNWDSVVRDSTTPPTNLASET